MSDTGAIAQISRAYQLLAQATDLTDIRAVRDMAEAARLYARARHLGLETENAAAEIKVRATRKLGEALKAGEMNKGAATPQRAAPGAAREAEPPTLADVGITQRESSESQAVAALPAEDFEAILAETKEAGKPIATKPIVREGRKRKRAATQARRNAPRKPQPEQVVNVQRIEDAYLAADFTRWLAYTTRISALSPERVFECLTPAENERVSDSLDHFVRWVESFKAVRDTGPRLQAVGGS